MYEAVLQSASEATTLLTQREMEAPEDMLHKGKSQSPSPRYYEG